MLVVAINPFSLKILIMIKIKKNLKTKILLKIIFKPRTSDAYQKVIN